MRVWMRFVGVLAVTGMSLMLAGCGGPVTDDKSAPGPAAEQRYDLKGTVVSVDKSHANLTVNHEEIKGFMAAMTMPDHLHLALRGNIEQSPLEIAAAYQNNLAYLLRQGRIWSRSFYVGTFGEYTTHALRKSLAE